MEEIIPLRNHRRNTDILPKQHIIKAIRILLQHQMAIAYEYIILLIHNRQRRSPILRLARPPLNIPVARESRTQTSDFRRAVECEVVVEDVREVIIRAVHEEPTLAARFNGRGEEAEYSQ